MKEACLLLLGMALSILGWFFINLLIKPRIYLKYTSEGNPQSHFMKINKKWLFNIYDVKPYARLSIKDIPRKNSWYHIDLEIEDSFIPYIDKGTSWRRLEILLKSTEKFADLRMPQPIRQKYLTGTISINDFQDLPNDVKLNLYVICSDGLTGIRRIYSLKTINKDSLNQNFPE